MDIMYRVRDIEVLRNEICQAFIEMILKPCWRQQLFDKASDEVENDKPHKNEYETVYGQMRSHGVDNYEIENMDVTLISGLVFGNVPFVERVSKKTRDALYLVRGDRNVKGHSGEKENADALYSRAWSDLNNLMNLVVSVDKEEKHIDNSKRLSFRGEFVPRIESLQTLIDDERIRLVQRKKDIATSVSTIKSSSEPLQTWINTLDKYFSYCKGDGDKTLLYDFIVQASDSGVAYAHPYAADYYTTIKKDYEEAEKRLEMIYESIDELKSNGARKIIDVINTYLSDNNHITEGMIFLVSQLKGRGYTITQHPYGILELEDD